MAGRLGQRQSLVYGDGGKASPVDAHYQGSLSRTKELGFTWDETRPQIHNEKQMLDWHRLGRNAANEKYLQERGYSLNPEGKSKHSSPEL